MVCIIILISVDIINTSLHVHFVTKLDMILVLFYKVSSDIGLSNVFVKPADEIFTIVVAYYFIVNIGTEGCKTKIDVGDVYLLSY